MLEIKGDFLGFQFDDVHSSDLGIIRVSDGSRYTENLLPTIQDKTTQIPGADGMYFFGSWYTQKQISFSFAYDHLTEEQFRKLKVLFGDKKIHDLIFDEWPYKVFKVKITGTPNLKYICFNEPLEGYTGDIFTKEELYGTTLRNPTDRIYKGEGQLSFVTYVPFANSRYKYLDEYTVNSVPSWGTLENGYVDYVHYNLYDWRDSSRLLHSATSVTQNDVTYSLDKIDFEFDDNGTTKYQSPGNVLVYNAGDIDTHFKLYLYFENGQFPGCTLGANNNEYFGKIVLKDFELADGDSGICINTKLNLIEGVEYTFGQQGVVSIEPTGTIYNKYIESGDFFKIKPTPEPVLMPLVITDFNSPTTEEWIGSIDYKYYYL
jgi:hypothetical protein